MPRIKKWKVGKFKILKLKLYDETMKKYKEILRIKGKKIQEDYEDYVNSLLNK